MVGKHRQSSDNESGGAEQSNDSCSKEHQWTVPEGPFFENGRKFRVSKCMRCGETKRSYV